jgi:hypothetical protein
MVKGYISSNAKSRQVLMIYPDFRLKGNVIPVPLTAE